MTAQREMKPGNLVKADAHGVERAVAILHAGGIAALPTDTVYGLAADAANEKPIQRLFTAKGRPDANPLVVQIATFAEAQKLGAFSPTAKKLAEKFWPGALTLVVPYRGGAAVARTALAGLTTIGLRIPAHEVTRGILTQTGPLAITSANRSGEKSLKSAVEIARALGNGVDIILDDGTSPLGIESTVVEIKEDEVIVLREGAVSHTQLKF